MNLNNGLHINVESDPNARNTLLCLRNAFKGKRTQLYILYNHIQLSLIDVNRFTSDKVFYSGDRYGLRYRNSTIPLND